MALLQFTPETAVQEAIIRLTSSDDNVKAQIVDRIYNEPPQDIEAFPYIHLDGMNSRRMDAGCGTARTVTMRFWCVSGNEFGWLGAWRLANSMSQSLEDKRPQLLEGYTLQSSFQVTMSASTVDPAAVKAVAVDIVCTVGSTPRITGD